MTHTAMMDTGADGGGLFDYDAWLSEREAERKRDHTTYFSHCKVRPKNSTALMRSGGL